MLQQGVAQGIHRIENAYTNWYIVEDGRDLTIVDAGVPKSWNSLLTALATLGRTLDDIKALVITHGHFDHLGFAHRLAERGVPVHINVRDAPLARNPRHYAKERSPLLYPFRYPANLPMQLAMVFSGAFFVKRVDEVRTFTGDEPLDVPGKPRVILCPGHTAGECALHFPDRDVLLVGDAFVTLNPYTGGRGPRIVSGAATADSKLNMSSLDALVSSGANTVLTGHGEPWTQGIAEAVRLAKAEGPS
jgi:glyoxylase-like metal-dependent hydrolase (beta-lactamase superfamily II)